MSEFELSSNNGLPSYNNELPEYEPPPPPYDVVPAYEVAIEVTTPIETKNTKYVRILLIIAIIYLFIKFGIIIWFAFENFANTSISYTTAVAGWIGTILRIICIIAYIIENLTNSDSCIL